MNKKNIRVFLDVRGHANLDSFPLRYGIHYQYNTNIELYNCENWEIDQKFPNRFHVDANFIGKDNKEEVGHFVLTKNQFNDLKIVTVWKNDMEVEYKLSYWLRYLREGNNISVQDLLELHPYYKNGSATNFDDIYKLLLDKDVKKITNEKLENVINDFKKELSKKEIEINDLIALNSKILKENKELQLDLDKAKNKITSFERSAFDKELNSVRSNNKKPMTISLGEKLLLTKVTEVFHRSSYCTQLEFSNGTKQWLKKRTFDKLGEITKKAKSLVNEYVITTSWNPKSDPTLWKRQGYFRNIYKAN